jgi:hypothetical protein
MRLVEERIAHRGHQPVPGTEAENGPDHDIAV